jgi:hypothetical protein
MTVTTPIRPKRSETPNKVPSSLDLQSGELAFNVSDQKIYTKSSSGNIVVLGKANVNKAEIDNLNIDASTVTGFTIDKSVPVDANFNDTTYETFTQSDIGLVPSPSADDKLNNKFLNANSEWSDIPIDSIESLNIDNPVTGQKLVYSAGEWINITEPVSEFQTTFIPNIVTSTTIIPYGSNSISIGSVIISEGTSLIVSLNASWVVL